MPKNTKPNIFLFTILLFIGIISLVVAFFAHTIGIDHNVAWGLKRIAILIFGIALTLCAFIYYRHITILLSLLHKFEILIDNHPISEWARNNRDVEYIVKIFKTYYFTLPIILFVFIAYVWFISAGLWTTWPPRTSYYAFLAKGFQDGQLSLPLKPDKALLALSNPYDPVQREIIKDEGVRIPLDFSLYKGKFYLYWGPVPALILDAASLVVKGRIGDIYLVFGFVCGIFLLQFLLIITIWDRFFSNLPNWILLVSILVVGLVCPSTFLLNNARIYEASISGGQFFIIGGFLAALSALDRPVPSNMRLCVAGGLWALAVGTRLALVIPIGFLVFAVAYRIYKSCQPPLVNAFGNLFFLSLPLAFGAISLGWYNWARFGSVFETGFSYQLAGPNLQKNLGNLFSLIYIPQNIYNYLLNPFFTGGRFPFIYPNHGNVKAIFPFYPLPDIYDANSVTGILYSVPFVLFALIPVFKLVINYRKNNKKNRITKAHVFFNWVLISLASSSLLAFILLMMFFWTGMRYIQDFMPALILFSVIGFWQGYKILIQKPVVLRLYSTIGLVLSGYSIIVSSLLAISGNIVRFLQESPDVLNWLIGIFPRFGG